MRASLIIGFVLFVVLTLVTAGVAVAFMPYLGRAPTSASAQRRDG